MLDEARRLEFEAGIRKDVPRNLLVEVSTVFPVGAQQANDVLEGTEAKSAAALKLSSRRKRRAIGLVRAQFIDEGFEQILLRHGTEFVKHVSVETGPDEKKDAPVFVTVGRFGTTLLGFASHRALDDLPNRGSKSRRALCSLNRGLAPDLFHPLECYRDTERFVILMVRRDDDDVGKIATITVCVLDARQERFIYQQELNEFVAGYGSAAPSRKAQPRVKDFTTTFKDRQAAVPRGGETEG